MTIRIDAATRLSFRPVSTSLWAGPDVHNLHRRSRSIPDPINLYEHDPVDGQPLGDFPDVFPTAREPNA